jgi:hypothetical protein
MTVPRIDSIGFCANYSPTGDRAYDYSLKIAREHGLKLNVFYFMMDPYDPDPVQPDYYLQQDLDQQVQELEQELRLYYDDRAGDFVEVGFRLCYDDSWRELHRCLASHEFQVLVLAKPEPESWFCRYPIDTFADRFVCPVVLVGPDENQPFQLNSSAVLLADTLSLPAGKWEPIVTANVQKA